MIPLYNILEWKNYKNRNKLVMTEDKVGVWAGGKCMTIKGQYEGSCF